MGKVQLRNETWYKKGLQNKVSSSLNLKKQEGRNKGDQQGGDGTWTGGMWSRREQMITRHNDTSLCVHANLIYMSTYANLKVNLKLKGMG